MDLISDLYTYCLLVWLISLEHGSISFMFFLSHFLLVKGSGELESRIIAFFPSFFFFVFNLQFVYLPFCFVLFLCNIFRRPKTNSVGNLRIKGTLFGFWLGVFFLRVEDAGLFSSLNLSLLFFFFFFLIS